MKAILMDDEPFSLGYLERICIQIPEVEVVSSFSDSIQGLGFLEKNQVDLVILDIEMPGLSGIEAVERLRGFDPDIGVIFVTGYEDYALQAFKMDAVAYLLKPCTVEELQGAVRKANRLMVTQKTVSIRTFGYFSVTVNGIPLRFSNSKAQELLALLVDRMGSVVTMEQAVDFLWEDRTYDEAVKRLYRKAVGYLNQVFEETGFFISNRANCHIVPDKADCDYFTLFQNPEAVMGLYSGEYMMNYSWAEPTNGKILSFIEKKRS